MVLIAKKRKMIIVNLNDQKVARTDGFIAVPLKNNIYLFNAADLAEFSRLLLFNDNEEEIKSILSALPVNVELNMESIMEVLSEYLQSRNIPINDVTLATVMAFCDSMKFDDGSGNIKRLFQIISRNGIATFKMVESPLSPPDKIAFDELELENLDYVVTMTAVGADPEGVAIALTEFSLITFTQQDAENLVGGSMPAVVGNGSQNVANALARTMIAAGATVDVGLS